MTPDGRDLEPDVASGLPAVGMITMGYGPTYPGGAEHQCGLLADELARRGRRVQVYAPSPSVDRISLRSRNPRVIPIPALPLPRVRTSTYLPMLALSLAAPGFEHPPILHTHMAWLHVAAPEIASRVTGARTLVKFACSGPDGDVANLSRSRLGRGALSLALRADRIVALTPAIADEIRSAGYPTERIRVIPNGVTIQPPVAAAADIESIAGRRVLIVGRLTAQKGIHPFLDAWAAVRDAVPDATVLIAGRGELAARIAARADEPDLEGFVRLLGYRLDVGALLSAVDVIVLPSRSEGMSNVALQALAAGKPVVGFDIPGIREVVRNEAALASAGDHGALAAAVVRVLRDATLRDELAGDGHRIVVSEFSIGKVTDQYEALYGELA